MTKAATIAFAWLTSLIAHAQQVPPKEDYHFEYEGNDPTKSVVAFLTTLETAPEFRGFAKLFDVRKGAQADEGDPFKTEGGIAPEGHTIKVFKLTKGAAVKNDPGKEDVLINGLHHAREWISGEFVLQFLTFLRDELRQGSTFFQVKEWTIEELLNKSELLFVPVVNPDGYVYSSSGGNDENGRTKRLWRKNRRRLATAQPNEVGVDLNRNYPAHWDPLSPNSRTSTDLNSDVFRGLDAASENEVRAVIKLHDQFNIIGRVDFHSAIGVIYYPVAFKVDAIDANARTLIPKRGLPDVDYFKQMAAKWSVVRPPEARLSAYEVRQASEGGNYITNGDAVDWAYEEKRIPILTPEIHKVPVADLGGADAKAINAFQPGKAKHVDIVDENKLGLMHYIFANIDRTMREGAGVIDGNGRKKK